MVQEQAFSQLLRELSSAEHSAIAIGESEVVLKVFDNKTKLSLMTPVYDGEGMIPSSVREAATHPIPSPTNIHTSLRFDEAGGIIFLSYIGALERLSKDGFRDLLETFAYQADRWRHYLDEHDHREKARIRRR